MTPILNNKIFYRDLIVNYDQTGTIYKIKMDGTCIEEDPLIKHYYRCLFCSWDKIPFPPRVPCYY